jgi:hypothetical protein
MEILFHNFQTVCLDGLLNILNKLVFLDFNTNAHAD